MANEENMFDEMEEQTSQDDASVAEELQKASEEAQADDSVFDYNALPDAPAQKYERVELHDQVVTIKEAVIEKPPQEEEWQKTLNGDAVYKSYRFKIVYDTENNDREYLSGLKGFKQDNGELSHPSLFRTGKNQVAQLFQTYKKKVLSTGVSEKEFEEKYGLKKFMAFLNSNPKAKIETVDIEFQGKTHRKNLVKEFV